MVKKIKRRIKKNKKKSLPSGGNCYEANGRWFQNNGFKKPGLILCHGEVIGQGGLQGIAHGHCWLEEHDEETGMVMVHDYSAVHTEGGLHVPAYQYYAVGQIGGNVVRYDHKTFNERLLKHKTWGPWEFKSSTGL